MNNIDYTDENITGDNDIMFRSLSSEGQSQVWYYVVLHHAITGLTTTPSSWVWHGAEAGSQGGGGG